MRILHTSDWHLGRSIEGYSRLDEQRMFMDELTEICQSENIELIIVAGDVYDTANPPSMAEQLFYRSVHRLTDGGKRPIIIIAGNHDSPERLVAPSPLAWELGIILIGTRQTIIPTGTYEHYSVIDSGEGFVTLYLNGETVVILTAPYAGERRLNEILSESHDEKEIQKSYSDKIGQMFAANEDKYRDDTINLAVGHFYVTGGETSAGERDITLGGIFAVNTDNLPKSAAYIAMGHLHRPQRINLYLSNHQAYYSGSPMQYGKSEIGHKKCVCIIDVNPGKAHTEPKALVTKKELTCYKPVEIWKFNGPEEAIIKCMERKDENVWAYLEIYTTRHITQAEIKELRSIKPDILDIYPVITNDPKTIPYEQSERSALEEFTDFYIKERALEPSDELKAMFLRLWVMCGEE